MKTGKDDVHGKDQPYKKKALDESEVSSKISKQAAGLMVHQKPYNSK